MFKSYYFFIQGPHKYVTTSLNVFESADIKRLKVPKEIANFFFS